MGLFNMVPYIGAWIGLSIPFVFLFTKHLEVVQTNGSGLNIYLIAYYCGISFTNSRASFRK